MVFPGFKAIIKPATTKQQGDRAEDDALKLLHQSGLRLLERNYRTPGRGGGEIDLIMRDPDGTLVFVEVRKRQDARQGGALASVTPIKQKRLVFAARHYLLRWPTLPPCRFDVVAFESGDAHWYKGAFDAI